MSATSSVESNTSWRRVHHMDVRRRGRGRRNQFGGSEWLKLCGEKAQTSVRNGRNRIRVTEWDAQISKQMRGGMIAKCNFPLSFGKELYVERTGSGR